MMKIPIEVMYTVAKKTVIFVILSNDVLAMFVPGVSVVMLQDIRVARFEQTEQFRRLHQVG